MDERIENCVISIGSAQLNRRIHNRTYKISTEISCDLCVPNEVCVCVCVLRICLAKLITILFQ